MVYKFKRTLSIDYVCHINADSIEDAKRKLEEKDCEWKEENGGEYYLSSLVGYKNIDGEWEKISDEEMFGNKDFL